MKIYGSELAERIKREMKNIEENIENREKRISEGSTDYEDCYMQRRIDEENLSACRMKLEILSGDGTMLKDVIVDENGKEVSVYWFRNKWGKDTIVGRGIFASSRKALLKKTGWTEKKINVPVWVKWKDGCGGGTCALYTGGYQRVRWHTNMVTGEFVGFPE